MASVWLQNSLRGAAGLAIAVYIAQRTGVQHGFWVVLGTLSVLDQTLWGPAGRFSAHSPAPRSGSSSAPGS